MPLSLQERMLRAAPGRFSPGNPGAIKPRRPRLTLKDRINAVRRSRRSTFAKRTPQETRKQIVPPKIERMTFRSLTDQIIFLNKLNRYKEQGKLKQAAALVKQQQQATIDIEDRNNFPIPNLHGQQN